MPFYEWQTEATTRPSMTPPFEVLQVAINAADRPSTNDVLELLMKVINHTFDFRKKVSINMELMQSNAARMATYSIFVGILQHMLTLLANIKTAAKSNYGLKFCSAMHAIRKKYTYNHVHDAMLLQVILMELVEADGVRILKDTPAPSTGAAHSVTDSVSYLQAVMDGDTSSKYTELAYGACTNSNLLEEVQKLHGRNCKKSQHSKLHVGHKEKKKDKDNKPKKNTCPHCKKFHCRKHHCVNPDKCMWNKKYKGYRFKSISDEIKVAFKPPHKLLAELGGYAEKEALGSY
jgi:hypothetical protein